MAEIKNSFLASKMNKDLDDRLVPNGEYRDALNISVGKSERDDIGAVQNALGNMPIVAAEETGLTCIGFFMDDQNNRIYRFLTDYTDPSPSNINMAPVGTSHKITVYDFNTTTYSTLVEGIFLNFSTTNLVLGVNLLEGLLFFTDNRNQPRKINYNYAITDPNYYTTETQISVAKYAPVEAPILFREVNTTAIGISGLEVTVQDATGIVSGMTVISDNIDVCDYVTVLGDPVGNVVTLYSLPVGGINIGDKLKFLTSTMSDQSNNPDWPGDPAYLESKYIRFSYRFKFDDNEYSILAPFSQIAYIPKQKGYFINGDEQAAYRSTILKWMENNTNNVEVLIPLPDIGSNIRNSYKITGVEILYKESNSLAIKVLDTVSYLTIAGSIGASSNIYTYKYQSQKPYKTLSEDQITRVYDKVPTRALAQELSGNRIIYGNFYTTYTPPAYIDYKVGAQPKNQAFTNFIEYPNHTLKQNRNYQVGFVLADKFGRQSSVILSTVDLATLQGLSTYGSSTIYSPYKTVDDPIFPEVRCWQGNALRVLVNNVISSTRDIPAGTPGLYARTIGNGFAISSGTIDNGKFTYSFRVDSSPIPNPDYPTSIPKIGDYLRGKYTDYVKITLVEWVWDPPQIPATTSDPADFPEPPYGDYIITTDGAMSDLYLHEDLPLDVKYAYDLNQIGWYSYKVVVKQREQDYYNVYLPGMLDGYPIKQTSGSQVVYSSTTGDATLENGINITNFPVNETGKTSHIVLINDNINKVPRDLAEVGPDQKQYRSSVELYGRVENYPAKLPLTIAPLDITDLNATSITYNVLDDPYDLLNIVKPGDGIQCNIPNAPTGITLPEWYGDTVITSIENFSYYLYTPVVNNISITINVGKWYDILHDDEISYDVAGTPYTGIVDTYAPSTGVLQLMATTTVDIPKGTKITIKRPNIAIITFSPGNPILGLDSTYAPYVDFTITTAENWQYYPLRKADIVNTIAYATDFNFLSNTVNNITGTAGLNFYQLQSNPLIGRISTSKKMGTLSEDMIPVLGIYETSATESLLDLFWETSTTGLISDLNWAVLTDFNGATGTTTPYFDFWEDQHFDGINDDPNDNSNTGDFNSPFITQKFFIVDNVNNAITPVTCDLFSVFDLSAPTPIDVTSMFQLVTVPGTIPTYRIKITNNFDFNYFANTIGSFKFTLKVFYAGLVTYIQLATRLKNRPPAFTHPEGWYDKTIDLSYTNIIQMAAVNGAAGNDQDGLYWKIISGNDDLNFEINSSTGMLSLINPVAQLGVYQMEVQVWDAASFATIPPSLLQNTNADLSSKSDTILVTITIGDEPVNDFLQYWQTDYDTFQMPEHDPEVYASGYFGVYVGTQIDTNAPGVIPTLPYNEAILNEVPNVEVSNGALGGIYPYPKGLTNGSLRFRWTQDGNMYENGPGPYSCVLIYYRPNSTSTWSLIKDDNNEGATTAPWWGAGQFTPFATDCLAIYPGRITLLGEYKTKTGSIKVSQPGEYFFAIKVVTKSSTGPTVVVEDANYYYKRTLPVYPDVYNHYTEPFLPRERFVMGLVNPVIVGGVASGVPYDSFSPDQDFNWQVTTTVAALDTVSPTTKFILVPTTNINQITAGVWVTKNADSQFTSNVQVTGFNTATNEVTILGTFPSGAVVVGDTLTFRELQKTSTTEVRPLGEVWATGKDFTFIRQFYNQAGFLSLWQPPVDNKFYNFKATPEANPNLPVGSTANTNIPNANVTVWGSAQIDPSGEVTTQIGQNNIKVDYNGLDTNLATIVHRSEWNAWWPIVESGDIGSNYIIVSQLPDVSEGVALLSWSDECTTPTELYYPSQTVDSSYFTIDGTYTITGLTPNTVYYIMVYSQDPQGYIGGDYHPIAVRTLSA